jgi:hypothetical protein
MECKKKAKRKETNMEISFSSSLETKKGTTPCCIMSRKKSCMQNPPKNVAVPLVAVVYEIYSSE